MGTGPQNIEAAEIDGEPLEGAETSASTNEASTPRSVDPVPRVDGSDASVRLPPEPPPTVAEFQPPEGLRVEALPGMQPVDVAHGIGCVMVALAPDSVHAAAVTVLWANQARQLAALLLQQADYSEKQLFIHSRPRPVSSTGEESSDRG